ncbi:MAG: tRNA uridine(34) 5-carboxymethylaminomethyl modification radical SAM/GNAT enzyme Elp3, partial [Patescibacteria group bacterium]
MDFSKINLDDNQVLAREIIEEANNQNFKNRHDFEKFRNSLIKKHKGRIFHNLYFIRAYNDLLKEGKIAENQNLLSLIRKRSVRTLSGVAPVTVMTKPFPCPGRCVYCPTDVRMPKSYLPSQPAAQRAFRQRFNPYTQVFVRLKALHMTGHKISKVELRVIGGTWSAYPKRYQKWFIKQSLQALNEFSEQVRSKKISQMKDLIKENIVKSPYGEDKVTTVVLKPLNGSSKFEDVVKINETSDVRCIGINIETRPDFIDEKEVRLLRSLGVTKVEMGVQTVDDEVQKITCRGHDLACVKRATKLLKDAGMKVGYHMMPNLPGSTVALDKRMVGELFTDEGYQPDYLKIYPCVVVAKSKLAIDFKKGLYKPYDESVLKDVLLAEMKDVPPWCRIDRIARDIPSTELIAGFKSSNIRQILEKELIEKGIPCRDIRSREVKNEEVSNVELVVRKYSASGGEELFLSYEDVMKDKLVALLRLRFPSKTFLPELKNAALIREIHVYGKQIAVGEKDKGESQHVGWGTKL